MMELLVVAVKGSKQYQMVVVPHRPIYKVVIFCLCLAVAAVFSFSTYHYGLNLGHESRVEVVAELEESKKLLVEGTRLISDLRQKLVALKLGGEIDSQATAEVQGTLESYQSEIAALKEEIRFYKGVLLPDVEGQGLRIERLEVKSAVESDGFTLSLLLTQVVEKHNYIQGRVEIKLVGTQDGDEKQLTLSQLADPDKDSIRFKFRYFQNINSDLKLPSGFQPRRLMVVAQSSGRNSQRLEKSISWQLDGD